MLPSASPACPCPDVWAKAGLMARETLDAGSRFAAAFATPAMNGCFFQWRDPANAYASTAGSFPANYPYTWLRLKRAGNTFTGFAGYDGQTWAQLGSASIAMSSQVYFGMAVTSHNTTSAAVAQFRDMADVTSGVIAPVASSARTARAIQPQNAHRDHRDHVQTRRPDGPASNVEFIEIYNSNPWYQDISGYRLKGSNLELHLPRGNDDSGRRLSGGRCRPCRYSGRLRCRRHGALHRLPEESRHAQAH